MDIHIFYQQLTIEHNPDAISTRNNILPALQVEETKQAPSIVEPMTPPLTEDKTQKEDLVKQQSMNNIPKKEDEVRYNLCLR